MKHATKSPTSFHFIQSTPNPAALARFSALRSSLIFLAFLHAIPCRMLIKGPMLVIK